MSHTKHLVLAITCMLFGAIGPSCLLQAQSISPTGDSSICLGIEKENLFAHYLAHFPLLSTFDTTPQYIDIFPNARDTIEVINDMYYGFIQPIPFFRTYPVFKSFYNWGLLVCIRRSYSTEYTNFEYLEFITYDSIGNILSQTTIPIILIDSNNSDGSGYHSLFGDLVFSDTWLGVNYSIIGEKRQSSHHQIKFNIYANGLRPIIQHKEDNGKNGIENE